MSKNQDPIKKALAYVFPKEPSKYLYDINTLYLQTICQGIARKLVTMQSQPTEFAIITMRKEISLAQWDLRATNRLSRIGLLRKAKKTKLIPKLVGMSSAEQTEFVRKQTIRLPLEDAYNLLLKNKPLHY